MADIKQVALPDGVTYDLVDDSAAHIISLTTAQWEALTPEQKASGDYVITDATMVPLTASAIPYSNTSSGLTADDVQEAIDEIAAGGGGGGTTNYNNLTNKPQINSVTLSGDKSSSDLKIVWQGTQAQYDLILTKDPDTMYFITDAPIVACDADEITYNHTVSGLSATDVKGALDELADEKMDKANPTGIGSLSLNKKSGTTLGVNAVAVGYQPTASGDYSFAEGYNCTASGIRSHAEGTSSVASGNYSHAENSSTASNAYAHAEGNGTVSSASASHSEGNATEASGAYAHAEGNGTKASGYESHAEGTGTIANHLAQHVFGQYNLEDTSTAQANVKGTYVEIVGKGTSNASRSNARTLDWNGNEVLAGGLKINGTQDVVQQVRFSIPKSSSKTVTVGQDLAIVSFLVSVTGNIGTLNHFLFFVSGYATASRCIVSTLVNTTGASQFTITATNTSNTIFTFNNLNTTNEAQVSIIPLFHNTFTIT